MLAWACRIGVVRSFEGVQNACGGGFMMDKAVIFFNSKSIWWWMEIPGLKLLIKLKSEVQMCHISRFQSIPLFKSRDRSICSHIFLIFNIKTHMFTRDQKNLFIKTYDARLTGRSHKKMKQRSLQKRAVRSPKASRRKKTKKSVKINQFPTILSLNDL